MSPQNHAHRPMTGKRIRRSIFLFSSFFVALALFACSGGGSQTGQQQNRAVPVDVGTVERKDVPVQLHAVGTVEAYSTVSVRSQVAGVLAEVHFKEGQEVRKGDLLFTIDQRPFRATVAQAEANLARDQAQARQASEEVRRYEDLVKKDYVTQEQFDQIRTNAEALSATVQADQALLDNVRLQLSYCSIRSPLDGKTSDLKMHAGNVIKANDTELLTINQMKPIYVRFALPQVDLERVQKHAAAGNLEVEAAGADTPRDPVDGTLSFINNSVDESTGTFQLKAEFSNTGEDLWPGEFANVVITLATEKNAIVVPSQAIQTGQQGDYVFVVKPDHTVEMRPVEVVSSVENVTVVGKGLNPGETVVTDGQLNLVPGASVEIKSQAKV